MMNARESTSIVRHTNHGAVPTSPTVPRAVRRPTKERKHQRHDFPEPSSAGVAFTGPRDQVEFGIDRKQHVRGLPTGAPFNTRPVLKTSTSGLLWPQSDYAPPLRRLPPCERLPLAPLPSNKAVGKEKSSHRSSKTSQHSRCTTGLLQATRIAQGPVASSPRKLLWPTDRSKISACATQDPSVDSNGQCQQQRYQTCKPQRHKSPFKPKIIEIKSPPERQCRPCLPRTPRLARKRLSYAEQKYTPMQRRKLDCLRNAMQTTLGRERGIIIPEPLQEEKRPGLFDLVLEKLPQSPPTLHTHESRAPPNPGSPSRKSSTKPSISSEKSDVPLSLLPPSEQLYLKETSLRNTMRKLLRWEIWAYRIFFGTLLVVLNISLLIVYLFAPRHHYLLAFLVFMKSKDLLSTIAGVFGILWYSMRDLVHKPDDVDSKWIMSIVCAYAETEVQILKTINSLVNQDLVQHKQVVCVILDGKPRDVLSHFTRITHMMKRSYVTWKFDRGELQVHAGFINDTPILLIQKSKNAGKKDTLILGHSLFNYPRDDAPMDIKLLRRDLFTHILPSLTGIDGGFKSFDHVYATDADSTIHKDCLKELVNALSRNPKAIAACGIIIADLEDSSEWSAWHLFQQFQYTFGQYVRRQAESVWGRVTCLPGPVTMTTVRPEMGKAISDYAAPVTTPNLFLHQVQYQGTDRRLTWCMLSQNRNLKTILVTKAIGETVVPTTLDHYLSQRRRWAANAYFNDYMYAFGKEQHPITRLFGIIDIVRMSFVYYRVINTALFIRSLVRNFYLVKIIPTLVLTKSPTTWFLLLLLIKEPVLRKRLHKILCGIVLNQFMSPILSVIVFSRVLLNMGNHAWGKTGVSSKEAAKFSVAYMAPPSPKSPWSSGRLVSIIKKAVHPSTLQDRVSENKSQRTESSSQTSVHTPTAGSKASSFSASSDDQLMAMLPLVPRTPSTTALSSTVTPTRTNTSAAATPNGNSTVRQRVRHAPFVPP